MLKVEIADGVVHKMPLDLRKTLMATPKALQMWQSITPLARNEWICLVDSAKQAETRNRRIRRTLDQLSRGQRRPCCWAGCTHRVKNGLA